MVAGQPSTPRQTGSLAVPGQHDDVITRMKNIELIELGKHQIKPWYFSPYPQVGRRIEVRGRGYLLAMAGKKNSVVTVVLSVVVSAGVGFSVLHLHLRVLPAVRAEQEVSVEALGQVWAATPAGQRDLPQGQGKPGVRSAFCVTCDSCRRKTRRYFPFHFFAMQHLVQMLGNERSGNPP